MTEETTLPAEEPTKDIVPEESKKELEVVEKLEVEKVEKPQEQPKPTPKKESKDSGNIAIIRIRGAIGVQKEINDTFKMLRLQKKNSCAVLPLTKSSRGMAIKVKDYATWGEIDEATLKLLEQKRPNQKNTEVKIKSFNLSPPKGGFERRGIKVPFTMSGALGYRGEKIIDLIKKMI
ncbi:uL30 family ribosomal protein [Nanoarchaeota archaeon]